MTTLIILYGVLVILALNSAIKIEKATIAIITRFGRRIPGFISEGLHFTLPFIDRIEPDSVYTTKLQTMNIGVTFLTADEDTVKELQGEDPEGDEPQLEIILKGTMRWMVNPYIEDENGIVQFSNIAPDTDDDNESNTPQENLKSNTFKEGVLGKIKSELGRFGGIELYLVFINKRRAVEHYINSILKLEVPPHVNPEIYLLGRMRDLLEDEFGNLSPEDENYLDSLEEKLRKFCRKRNKEDENKDFDPLKIDKEIPRRHRLKFYDKFSNEMGEILRSDESASSSKTDHSSVEELYGVEFVEFTIDKVQFTEETKKALEKEAQALGEIEGMVKFSEKAREIAGKVIEESNGDITWKEAMRHAEAVLKIAEKKNFNLEGIPKGLIKL